MSSRALRKAQREREEQERLQKLEQDEEDELELELERGPTQSTKSSAFAMLGEQNDADNDEDGELEPQVSRDEEGEPPASESIPRSSRKRKKKKKKKKKANSGDATPSKEVAENGNDQLDEIDRALKQLSASGDNSVSATTISGVNRETEELCKLLTIDTSHLHAQNEMRRLFGRTALEQQDEDQPQNAANAGGNRRQQRRAQQVGLAQALRGQARGGRSSGLAAMALRRNIFILGKEDWPNATGGGLGMEVEEKRADGTVLYRFVHNRAYQDVQSQFAIAVESMDPNRLIVMLQQYPYHISSLLQVSEIAKQERENAVSGDLLERALFSFGRAVHSSFAKTLAEGRARLDFRHPENREFWLASWRYMQNLSMRATWRTVYEWAKLLLSFSPEEDPYAIWLVLDQYALRTRQDLDFLNMSRNTTFRDKLRDAPNIQLSQGLAEFRAGNKGKGKQALFTAVGRYPWVVARLMQELNVDPLPPAIWGKEPRTEKEKLDAELYATRAKDVWNTPETSALLLEVASALPPDNPSAPVDTDNTIHENEARHVLLSDVPALIALIPREYTARLQSTSDPLPPDDSYPSALSAASSTSPESIQRELESIYSSLSSLAPELSQEQISPEGVNRVIEQADPEQGRRIVQLLHRLDTLQERVIRMHGGLRPESVDEPDVEDDAQSEERRRAEIEDALADND